MARRLLEGRSVYSSTKAIVIANSDRLQPMYPTAEGGIRPFIEAFHEYATTVIFTITTPPMANARGVDYLFRIEGGNPNPKVRFGSSPSTALRRASLGYSRSARSVPSSPSWTKSRSRSPSRVQLLLHPSLRTSNPRLIRPLSGYSCRAHCAGNAARPLATPSTPRVPYPAVGGLCRSDSRLLRGPRGIPQPDQ
jgi:hypothetical protein